MQADLSLKKQRNLDIAEREQQLEHETRQLREKTDLQDSLYKELHLIKENFRKIKKHELTEIERSSVNVNLNSKSALFAEPTERSEESSSDDEDDDIPSDTQSGRNKVHQNEIDEDD